MSPSIYGLKSSGVSLIYVYNLVVGTIFNGMETLGDSTELHMFSESCFTLTFKWYAFCMYFAFVAGASWLLKNISSGVLFMTCSASIPSDEVLSFFFF
jgi:hypothetical protein